MKEIKNPVHSGWPFMAGKIIVVLLVAFSLANCTPAAAPTPTAPVEAPTATVAGPVEPSATMLPSPTATQPPTATPEPSATPTALPTATQVPALGLQDNGYDIWCAPLEFSGTSPTGPDAPVYAQKMVAKDAQIQVHIPAAYCVLAYRFNQAVPDGTALNFFSGKTSFLKLPLKAAQGHPEEAWASVTHTYVVNPPAWLVEYRLSVTAPDGKELWSQLVRFAKTLPAICADGRYPDPVTLYCNSFDPREIEPHPENPNYPYTTPNP